MKQIRIKNLYNILLLNPIKIRKNSNNYNFEDSDFSNHRWIIIRKIKFCSLIFTFSFISIWFSVSEISSCKDLLLLLCGSVISISFYWPMPKFRQVINWINWKNIIHISKKKILITSPIRNLCTISSNIRISLYRSKYRNKTKTWFVSIPWMKIEFDELLLIKNT